MRRTRRFPHRLVRWTSLCVCFAFVLSFLSVVPFPQATISFAQGLGSPNGQGTSVPAPPPLLGPPAANLPDLDQVRRRPQQPPETPMPLPSVIRSRRTPLSPRDGRKVGDPGTTLMGAGYGSGSSSDRAKASVRVSSPTVRDGSVTRRAIKASKLNHPRTTRSLPRAVLYRTNASPSPIGDDQYVQTFFAWALVRQPYSGEQTYWNDILRVAYAKGQTSMVMASRELGKTLFESSDYATRNRSNHDFVYDLYKTYLLRDPDGGGWAYWEAQVPSIGREATRRAFDESGEFIFVVSTVTPNGSASSAVSSLLTARVDPNNQRGGGLLTRDATWGVPLLSLPGRAGLDLGLGLSYSSAVWTRSGPVVGPTQYIYFDEDDGWPSPGFRLGFPTIQEKYFDAQVGVNAYVLIAGSGRVELRQVGASNVYEAADSSYLQLTDNGTSLLVRTTDGTQMSYAKFSDEWRCTQVKDRNGNFITINYDWMGHITNITDTLGRVITFNYDSNANPISITQTWNGQTHTWATFGWTTVPIQTSFSGMAVSGAPNGTVIPVLNMVGFDDGSYCKFLYNAYAQVTRVTHYASDSNPATDNHPLNYTAFDYGAVDDITRLIATRVWAENWNGLNGVPSEVTTQFTLPVDGSHQMTAPDGTVAKEFYGTGWQKGLATSSEVWSGGVKQKWNTTAYTQDNTGVNYQTNPRVTETNVYDAAGNRRRSTVWYGTFNLSGGGSCTLPTDTYEFAADAVTVLRRHHTDYNLAAVYTDRRIIGLPSAQYLCNGDQGAVPCNDSSGTSLFSKVTLLYDESGSVQNPGSPIQHDNTNYGASFVAGRGNVSSARRHDVNNLSQFTASSFQYNTAGAVVSSTDPLGHPTTISYTDGFSDSVNRNTFAYPTAVTNAGGFSAYLQYNFDFGARTRAQGPPPAGQSQGAIQTYSYDSAARPLQVTTANNNAYTRYVYGPTNVQSYSTVNTIADEAYSIQYFDGAGRVIVSAGNHPGSTGGYRAQNTIYDSMGRLKKVSNPAETNSSWTPTGDDAAGWVYIQQTYDWKGRPLVTTNPDGTQKSVSYTACGCAGSEVTTLTDEMGRRQKIYKDVLGRTAKSEVLNLDSTVYTTASNTYNALDQVTVVRQYQGADTSPTYQDTTATYDGYGRLKTRHMPEQNVGTATTWDYNADDTIQKVTEPRGTAATYTYNSRHLVTGITYSAPAPPVTKPPTPPLLAAPNVSFGYDAVGNRTSMTDGFGSKSYSYNQLSQLMSESRTFTGVGTYALSYDYNLAGELKKVTDATNMSINYGYDQVGRLSGVTGSGTLFMGITTYASNFQYRAWGGLKAVTDGANHVASWNYNSKLQPTHFEINGYVQNYDYNSDGRISFIHDSDANFDRLYSYDHVARLTLATTGASARNETGNTPYHETFGYDPMSNLTSRSSSTWGQDAISDGATYTNNRRSGWGYDADGNNITIGTRAYSYNSAGQMALMTAQQWQINHYVNVSHPIGYDGDGQQVKDGATGTTYYLRSSVLRGAIIEELNYSGQKSVGYVYNAGGKMLARQMPAGGNSYIAWKSNTPAGTTQLDYNVGGVFGSGSQGRIELDPLSANIGLTAPDPPDTGGGQGDIGGGHFGGIMDARWSDFFNVSSGCAHAGFAASCSQAMEEVNFERRSREVFGERWYDLPGNNNEIERAERQYVAGVAWTTYLSREDRNPEDTILPSLPAELLQPQNPPQRNPSVVKRDFYRNYQQALNNCINQVFGADAGRIPRQTLRNAPNLDARLNRTQVGAISGVATADGSSRPFRGSHGTVYVASEVFTGNTPNTLNAIYGTFVHELGNVLDIRLNPNAPQAQYGRTYGNPNDPVDTDTGAALERCVFGSLQYP